MTALLGRLTAGHWTLETAAADARFQARDVMRKTVEGTLPVLAAGVEVSPDGVPMHVWADLDLAGVETGNARRDRDLRGARFFDVEKDGVLRFTATAGRSDAEQRWVLPGELTHKDARCPLEVTVEVVASSAGSVTVRASASLDRRDIGITVPRLLVGRTVAVAVDAVLVPPSADAPT